MANNEIGGAPDVASLPEQNLDQPQQMEHDCVEAHGGPTNGGWSKEVITVYTRRTGWQG